MRFQFCFDGMEAAKRKCLDNSIPIIFWHNKRRHVAIPCQDGAAVLPFETKEECFAVADTLDNMALHVTAPIKQWFNEENNLPIA